MQETKYRLDLDQLRVMSFPTLPEREEPAVKRDAVAAGPTAWTRCSIFICD